jgi:hypothetical protein
MNRIIDSNGKQYQETPDGTCFDYLTPQAVVGVLEDARINHRRLRIFLGDTVTGKSWNEENDVVGYIGRSMGQIKVPLLLSNNRSSGGGSLLDNCIIKIVDVQTHCTVYKHERFHQSEFVPVHESDMPEYHAGVMEISKSARTLYARCKSIKSAERLAEFMNGTRMNK